MRVFLAIALLVSIATSALSDPPIDDPPIPWQGPFEPISASKAGDTLVLMLITNEDPFLTAESTRQATQRNPEDDARLNPPVWCAEVLGRAYRKAMDRRTDLRNRIKVQSIVAGLPKELTGGKPSNTPARAVLAVCDGNYRLLSFLVGVPEVDELTTLIEDAEDVAAMRQLNADQPNKIVLLIAQRSSQRLGRRWQGALEELVLAMQGDAGDVPDTDQDRCGRALAPAPAAPATLAVASHHRQRSQTRDRLARGSWPRHRASFSKYRRAAVGNLDALA